MPLHETKYNPNGYFLRSYERTPAVIDFLPAQRVHSEPLAACRAF